MDTGISSVVIAQGDPQIAYACSGFDVFGSADGGESWRKIADLLEAGAGYGGDIAVDPEDPHTLHVGTADGVFRTRDGGGAWGPVTSGLYVNVLAMDTRRPATLYAGTTQGVYVSVDHGDNWSQMGRLTGSVSVLAVDRLCRVPYRLCRRSPRGSPELMHAVLDNACTYQRRSGSLSTRRWRYQPPGGHRRHRSPRP